MGAYGNIDSAICGLQAETNGTVFVESWNAAKEDIPFGTPLFANVGEVENAQTLKLDTAKLVFSTDLVASNVINMKVNTVAMSPVTFLTDHVTTMGLIVTALRAMTGVEAVLDPADTNNRTIWVRTKDKTCSVTDALVTLGAGQATITITTYSSQIFIGIALFTQKAIYAYNEGNYKQYEQMSVLRIGKAWINTKDAVKANDEAYIYATAGSDFGKFTYTSGGYNVGARFRSNTTVAGLAIVEINYQARPVATPTYFNS